MNDAEGQKLHDRATCGERLTEDEQKRLAAWYAEHDAAESALLSANEGDDAAALRLAVRHAAAQVQVAAERVASLTIENQQLRDEVAALQRRLPLAQTVRPA